MLTKAILGAALALALTVPAAAQPNTTGWAELHFAAPATAGKPVLWTYLSAIAYKPTTLNSTNHEFVILSHYYFPLPVPRAAQLADGLDAWLDAPHSDLVFSNVVGSYHASLIGSAWNQELPPVIDMKLAAWTPGTDPAHYHGEIHVVLSVAQVEEIRDMLRAWIKRPVTGTGTLYEIDFF